MAAVVVAAGLEFPATVIGKIRARIARSTDLTRTELSREVCRWMNWRAANGQLRELACRLALLELERREELLLPDRRTCVRSTMQARRWEGIQNRPLRCELDELGKIELVGVRATENRELADLWNEMIAGYHYLGHTPLVGAQQRYLIESARHGYVGALGFSAAARRVAARDRWIGWSEPVRAERLHLVVCNSRFLILPWIRVPNLASRVLAMAVRQLGPDWKRRYGYEPAVLESYVEPARFSGGSYRAANWVEVGESRGRGRQDRTHAGAGTAKKVFVYPRGQNWREHLGVAAVTEPEDWAEREFGRARLGDARLTRRFVSIAQDFYSRPHANIPRACNGDRAKTKAVYRFFDNQDVTLAKLLEPHRAQTLKRAAEHAVVLAVQDSTTLNYSAHPATTGTGPIGIRTSTAIGLIVHDTVAVSPEGMALGVLDAQVWARNGEQKKAARVRPIEDKESVKWLRSYEVAARLQAELKHTRVVSVGDREADIYELFATAREHIEAGGPHLLVRAREDRPLLNTSKKLWERVEAQPLAGYREIVVTPRPGRKARTATLSVRFCEVVLDAPRGKRALGKIRLWAVHARERRAPAGIEAVEWMLLTTMEVSSFEQACEKLDWYTRRWMIEVFHRTLKTGCRIEDRQLGTVPRIENCLAIDMMIAVRIMHLTWLGRTHPTWPCTVYFDDHQWKALSCFLTRKPTPQKKVPSVSEVVGWIGKLGGHLGRNCDGPPGTQVLWEGIQRTDDIVAAMTIHATFAHGP